MFAAHNGFWDAALNFDSDFEMKSAGVFARHFKVENRVQPT
jgi:hypothetical protein